MEDVSVRAIMIGVSVLIAVATISGVMMYYNTAKEAVRKIGSGTDIAGMYEQSIEETLLKGKITGTEVKNVLNYFYGRNDVTINLVNISYYDVDTEDIKENAINGHLTQERYNKIIKFILPNKQYSVSHSVTDGITNITISEQL